MYQDVDIFQEGGPADKDLLDIAVEGYEDFTFHKVQRILKRKFQGLLDEEDRKYDIGYGEVS